VRRVEKLRAGAALMGVTAIALMASAIPAGAQQVTGTAGNATPENTGFNVKVIDSQKNLHSYPAKLFNLKVGDKTLHTYCVDIFTPINFGTEYVEKPWNEHSNQNSSFGKNAGKISWLLLNGYPNSKPGAIETKTQLKFRGGLSATEALTATQAAVWHFSDNVDLEQITDTSKDNESDVFDLYNWLISPANNKGDVPQPKPALALNPAKLSGKPGSLIGPFVATTNAENVVVDAKVPAGVKITDKDGKELDGKQQTTKDKYEFFVNVPAGTADGKAEITVSANATVSLGRLFVGKVESQALILAGEGKVKLEAKGEANWAVTVSTPTTEAPPAPQAKNNELANTGASVLAPVIIGVVLVGAGVGALVFQRRRKA
jgi:TQXA domain-containing protein/LPXTG-motif cell wall-anchored protein